MNEDEIYVCRWCGLVYIPSLAIRDTWVCACGRGGSIVPLSAAKRHKAQDEQDRA